MIKFIFTGLVCLNMFTGYRFVQITTKYIKLLKSYEQINQEYNEEVYNNINKLANFITALHECEKNLNKIGGVYKEFYREKDKI